MQALFFKATPIVGHQLSPRFGDNLRPIAGALATQSLGAGALPDIVSAAAICANSACEPHRAWIEAKVALDHNAVKRFIASIRKREPGRFDVLEAFRALGSHAHPWA